MDLFPGYVIDGKYRILRRIGGGGVGIVYEGENVSIGRRVAIKVLLPELSVDAHARARFEREARVSGRVRDDHILEVLDLGTLPGGERFIVMEFLEGESLADRLAASGRLSPEALLPLILQAIDGIAAAHDAGVIHRDLKPENLFIVTGRAGWREFVKLIDFGVSKHRDPSGMGITRTGTLMGTPYYMSPEQASGSAHVDHRADIYALGVILYECLAGEMPFSSTNVNELLFEVVLKDRPPLSSKRPGVHPRLEAIVHKALARDPGARYQTVRELGAALEAWLEETIGPRSWGPNIPTGQDSVPPPSTVSSSLPPPSTVSSSGSTAQRLTPTPDEQPHTSGGAPHDSTAPVSWDSGAHRAVLPRTRSVVLASAAGLSLLVGVAFGGYRILSSGGIRQVARPPAQAVHGAAASLEGPAPAVATPKAPPVEAEASPPVVPQASAVPPEPKVAEPFVTPVGTEPIVVPVDLPRSDVEPNVASD